MDSIFFPHQLIKLGLTGQEISGVKDQTLDSPLELILSAFNYLPASRLVFPKVISLFSFVYVFFFLFTCFWNELHVQLEHSISTLFQLTTNHCLYPPLVFEVTLDGHSITLI